MTAEIRLATPQDARGVQAIYAPIVRDTAISFELEPPTVEEMRQPIVDTLKHWPWLVCERHGGILGYVYASQHRARPAYQWSVDVSVYVHPNARRSGVGRALYRSLFALLALQGFYQAFAGITLPNPASVGLHEALGFQPIGVYRAVGYTVGAWRDVGWWQLALRERAQPPAPPLPLGTVSRSPQRDAALAAGMPLLRPWTNGTRARRLMRAGPVTGVRGSPADKPMLRSQWPPTTKVTRLSYYWLCGFLYRPTGTSSATVPPGARNLMGITPGSLMISQP